MVWLVLWINLTWSYSVLSSFEERHILKTSVAEISCIEIIAEISGEKEYIPLQWVSSNHPLLLGTCWQGYLLKLSALHHTVYKWWHYLRSTKVPKFWHRSQVRLYLDVSQQFHSSSSVGGPNSKRAKKIIRKKMNT